MLLVTRDEWGARPPKRPLAPITRTAGVKIHYEGTEVPVSLAADHGRCAPRMRALQASHLADPVEDYNDIAYTAVVCPHGAVYVGRGPGFRTGANGNPTLNAGHYAVCAMVGSSGLTEPTPEQLGGLVDAIEWLRAEGGAGAEVRGHRDGYATSCPGEPLYRWVQAGAPRPDAPTAPAPEPEPPAEPTPARYRTTIGGLEYGYGAHGPQVTAVGEALVRQGFGGHYASGPGPDWTDADTRNYQAFQQSLGYTEADADGVPGEDSLRRLLGDLPSAVPDFPGRDCFRPGAVNDSVRLLGEQLVRRGFGGHYRVGPSRSWGEADRLNVAAFQRSVPALAGDADGYPGPLTWRLLFS
ncbi:peptidoglycan-binding protein [Kitasatospora purpeofusca]|uniref:peptidoglycan-binding protein n=1 Tax=Kitasatospora purpeofusca TaxID=67352 RepID=UPI002E128D86|nr:peptidoglycan-binding protein [Kitasatospora purpeofusca]